MRFCVELLGNLGRPTGGEVCLELGGCVEVGEVVWQVLRSLDLAVDLEELLVTDERGEPLPAKATTCQVARVRVARLYRGG
jgi:hypothetical protein